ncbi:MAG TPA: peptidoglycan DD-metalloendopeptidase family protein [Oligoflexia bacterium]|nr:peptidoglycan DD-metalloendopeptidase family protein [Oligoflexia bacterium]HMP26926.1 peptidoglycan DD-metalloendopeptidase family protein [Oligoflexia bacterium]
MLEKSSEIVVGFSPRFWFSLVGLVFLFAGTFLYYTNNQNEQVNLGINDLRVGGSKSSISSKLNIRRNRARVREYYNTNSDLNRKYQEPLLFSPIDNYSNNIKQLENSSNYKFYKVLPNDTFSSIIEKITTIAEERKSLLKHLLALPKEQLRLVNGEEIKYIFSKEGFLDEIIKELSGGRVLKITRLVPGDFTSIIEHQPCGDFRRKVQGTITSSFAAALSNMDVPFSLVDDFVDLLSDRVEFNKDLQEGDAFTLIFNEKRSVDGKLISIGPILAAAIESKGNFYAAIRAERDNKDSSLKEGIKNRGYYYNERGELLGDFFLRYPVQFTRISSVFTNARFHPILHKFRAHNGVDFAAPSGTPVRAVGAGKVEFAGFTKEGGYTVKIKHNERYSSAYLHLSKIATTVKKNSSINKGSVLGYVGQTGLATGPHLHFSIYDKDKYVDPLKTKFSYEPPKEVSIPKQTLAAIVNSLRAEHQMVYMAADRVNKNENNG